MSLYTTWEEKAYKGKNKEEVEKLWHDYLPQEKSIYVSLLEHPDQIVKGKFNELAEKYGVSHLYFTGFLCGINDSLVHKIDLENMDENTDINLEIDFENLYFRMLELRAKELYTLPQWDKILTEEKRREIRHQQMIAKTVINTNKVGRNDPCPCGSGKKYKHCCGKN